MEYNAYQALRERCAFIDLTGRGKIRVTGEDRVRLLHAMSTNHVQQLVPGTGCYAFFLNPQGRILADVNIYAMPDHLLLDTEAGSVATIMEHLDRFIIADDVALQDVTAELATITVEGPAAEHVLLELGALPAHVPYSLVEWNAHSLIAHWSYTGGPGYAIYVPVAEKQALMDRLSAALVPHADLETADVVRLENHHPRYGVDFSDAQIPHETQQMHAIHFSKGCYIGQEIVERVRSRGQVNRQLTAIEIDAQEPPATKTQVQSGGRDLGEISSAAYSPALGKVVAFAVLRADARKPGIELTVAGADANLPD